MSELLGEARILIRPDTTTFRAQLEDQLAFARKPIVIPVVAGGAGVGSATTAQFAAAQEAAAVSAQNLSKALAIEASTAGKGAVILQATTVATEELAGAQAVTARNTAALSRTQASAAAVQARQLAQFERGAFSSTASQFGLRGATLAASASFIAAAVAVTALSKVLKSAQSDAENLTLANERLRESVSNITAVQINAWAAGLAKSLGVSRVQAVQFTAALEGLFKNFGVTQEAATKYAEELTKVAANISVVAHVPVEQAFTALQRGLAGNGRALRAFQIFVDAARVKQEALIETGKKQASSLTRQELLLARVNIILRDSADRQNAFAEASGSSEGQARIFQARISNLETTLGGFVNTVLAEAIKKANELGDAFVLTGKKAGDLGGFLTKTIPGATAAKKAYDDTGFSLSRFAAKALVTTSEVIVLGPALTIAAFAADKFGGSSDNAAKNTDTLAAALAPLQQILAAVSGAFAAGSISIVRFSHDAAVAQAELLKLRSEGAGPQAQIPSIEADIAAQQGIIARAKLGPAKGRATIITAARNQIVADRAALKSLNAEITAAAQKRAQEAKDAAQKAQQAQNEATQAFLDIFSGREQARQNAITTAGLTKSLADDIAQNRKLVVFERAEIAAIKERIRRLHLRGDALKAALGAIKTALQTIFDTRTEIDRLQAEQAQRRADAAQAARDARLTHLEALLSIAETTPGTGDDVRRLRAIEDFDRRRIAALKRKRKLTQDEKAELDALRVDLAQREKAIRDLIGQQKQNNTAAQAFFKLLQTQQGFASNLLGNLIPGFATGGLVGNASPTTSGRPPGLRQVAGGFEEARGALATQTAISGTPRGPSSGQAATTNELLRRILRTLEHLNTRTNHPEASRQRQTMNAAMDGVHGN